MSTARCIELVSGSTLGCSLEKFGRITAARLPYGLTSYFFTSSSLVLAYVGKSGVDWVVTGGLRMLGAGNAPRRQRSVDKVLRQLSATQTGCGGMIWDT